MLVEKSLEELMIGHYVVEIKKQSGNFKLTASGHIKSTNVIAHLANKGVATVIIDDEKTKITNEPINDDELPEVSQLAASQLTAKQLSQAKQIFTESKLIQRKVFDDAQNGCALDLEPVIEITNKSVETIFENPDALACVVNIRKKDEYLLEHSVAVSVYMTIFARYLKIDRKLVQDLSIGAFLHDVGKIMIPGHILNKPGKLTDSEFYIMKTHANHSIEIIKKTPGISDLSLEIAALHHEKLDGSGYPFQVRGDNISKYGRMIAICDIFDALTANRCYKDGYAHVKAFTILRNLAQTNHLDSELVDHFIKAIGVYPIGSLVRLNSNKIAIVERRNKKDPIRPGVRSFYSCDQKDFQDTEAIDLSLTEDFIVKGVKASEFNLNMDEVIQYLLQQG